MTVSVDLSQNVHLEFMQNTFTDHVKVYHAGSRALRITHESSGDGPPDEVTADDFQLSKLEGQAAAEEQFVTHYVSGALATDLVLRDVKNLPTTARDIEARQQQLRVALQDRGLSDSDPEAVALLEAQEALTPERQAQREKDEGNAAFRDRAYGQASAHYTTALEALLRSDAGAQCEALCTLYSNRAACALKLGAHEQALSDAEAGLALQADHVKLLFRKGMALHALKRYHEACPALSKALEAEPKNQQIRSALQFAQRRLAMTCEA